MSNKINFEERKISKYANSAGNKFRVIDAVDNLDTLHQSKNEYNKKITININSAQDGFQHKEKFAAFYWDLEDVLLVADDIIAGRFKENVYLAPSKKMPNPPKGAYSKYGGNATSRVLSILYKEGKYNVSVSLHTARKTSTGATLPGEKIDSHSIQLNDYDMRKFMKMVYSHCMAKLPSILGKPKSTQNSPSNQSSKVQVKEEPKKSKNEPFEDIFGDMFE